MANSNESKFLVCQELSDFYDFLLILNRGQEGKFTKLLLDQGRKTKEKKKEGGGKKSPKNDCKQVFYFEKKL